MLMVSISLFFEIIVVKANQVKTGHYILTRLTWLQPSKQKGWSRLKLQPRKYQQMIISWQVGYPCGRESSHRGTQHRTVERLSLERQLRLDFLEQRRGVCADGHNFTRRAGYEWSPDCLGADLFRTYRR